MSKTRKHKIPSKYQILNRFVDHSDKDCVCHYYSHPAFGDVPNIVLMQYIHELADEGYLVARIRYVLLTANAYTYRHEQRVKLFNKFLSILGHPVSYLFTWILGVCSGLLIEYLKLLFFQTK